MNNPIFYVTPSLPSSVNSPRGNAHFQHVLQMGDNGVVSYSGITTQTIVAVENRKIIRRDHIFQDDFNSSMAHAIGSWVCIYRLFGLPNPDLPFSVFVTFLHCLLKF